MQAADYFGDDAAVRDMSRVLGAYLFAEAPSKEMDGSPRKRKLASIAQEVRLHHHSHALKAQ